MYKKILLFTVHKKILLNIVYKNILQLNMRCNMCKSILTLTLGAFPLDHQGPCYLAICVKLKHTHIDIGGIPPGPPGPMLFGYTNIDIGGIPPGPPGPMLFGDIYSHWHWGHSPWTTRAHAIWRWILTLTLGAFPLDHQGPCYLAVDLSFLDNLMNHTATDK